MHCITTLYDENFVDPNNDATVLPYMEVRLRLKSCVYAYVRCTKRTIRS